MPIRTAARALITAAAAPALATAALATAVLVNAVLLNADAANASSPGSDTACAQVTRPITGMSAANAIHAVAANMASTCGFTISGSFEGIGFGIDGWGLQGTSSFAASGAVHLIWDDQSVITDFYRSAGHEYLRLYMAPDAGMPGSQATATLRAEWNSWGVNSNAVIKAAGTTKWVKLTAAQTRIFNTEVGFPLTSAALGVDIAKGSAEPWKLGGTKTVSGVRCTVLTDPANNSGPGYLGESLYVNPFGQPVQIRYASQDSQSVVASFGHWDAIPTLTPPASKVIVQP
jgi:hypothetical protein